MTMIEDNYDDNVQPDEADLPHRDWTCETCGEVNSCLDAECQYCDPVSLAAVRIAASLGDGHEPVTIHHGTTSQASTR